MPNPPKRLVWLVNTLDTLKRFPAGVRHHLGFALYQAQIGMKHESAKLLRGFESAVWQVRAEDPSGTYRAVYVAQFQNTVYVLHTFQKKSNAGIATRQQDIEVIRQRLKLARRLAGEQGD